MRLFLVPLSRTARAMHCHSTIAPAATSYLNRATSWASTKWESLAQAPKDSMKLKLYGAGSRMLEKIEHQETFFKDVPAKEDATITTLVPLLYPSSMKEAQVSAEFRTLLDHRIPYHRKYMIYSALCVPFTSLFTIIPVVPNIPFFYNAFRLWSHWKAYNGAKHLDVLIKSGGVSFQPSDVLNLGLQHDPQFAVFFTGSHQLSKRRSARRKHGELDPKAPVITESSGEITPTLAPSNGAGPPPPGSEAARGKKHPSTLSPKIDDPMSMTDHVAHEGFITDAEIETISLAFSRPPRMSSELKRARFQEAEKYVQALVASSKKDQ